jgi:D-sedoheptulose 7-phosphate isomerase
MQLELYKKAFNDYFNLSNVSKELDEAVQLIKNSKRIFFVGNGGSNSICSHMMEDFAKIGRIPTFSFSDAALITCFANDYGYDKAIAEWMKIHYTEGDVLVAISSSGKSANILNAVDFVNSKNGKSITLSGFDPGNPLKQKGTINFHIPLQNYGIVECYHQVLLHIVLDEIVAGK